MIYIPADIPENKREEFVKNYRRITQETDNLFLFAADQKIEHLNKDFFGPTIDQSIATPEHLFTIASEGNVGAFATQLGLIARYGKDFRDINYVVKLNSKTDIIPKDQKDPLSPILWSVADVLEFKKNSGLSICGIGYTVYLGSEYEHIMLAQAAQVVYQAHQNGLVAILWMYPRGKFVSNERDYKLIAGAAGVANCLGADFAKINPPSALANQPSVALLKIAVEAAGNTRLICSGGQFVSAENFIENLYDQLNIGGISGCATGRNIYQRVESEAVNFTKAISSLVYESATLEQALSYLKK